MRPPAPYDVVSMRQELQTRSLERTIQTHVFVDPRCALPVDKELTVGILEPLAKGNPGHIREKGGGGSGLRRDFHIVCRSVGRRLDDFPLLLGFSVASHTLVGLWATPFSTMTPTVSPVTSGGGALDGLAVVVTVVATIVARWPRFSQS